MFIESEDNREKCRFFAFKSKTYNLNIVIEINWIIFNYYKKTTFWIFQSSQISHNSKNLLALKLV